MPNVRFLVSNEPLKSPPRLELSVFTAHFYDKEERIKFLYIILQRSTFIIRIYLINIYMASFLLIPKKKYNDNQYREYLKIAIMLTVCYYHVTHTFQSESTLYSCLNVKEFLARNRHDIWILSDNNGIRTHNHLVCKPALNHGWVFIYKLSGCGFEPHY